ncbi:hypothetical protein KKF91_18975 [Myxococcota bacterium]|nr:hypothetical protein [Myxococcota bacterium]MBU1432628.1 hypothetical protein [Myxococcota bacterium]MBU1899509.1 hypothetical protein [Myxococcota bacterium]
MRLRDVSERVREVLEDDLEALFAEGDAHALIQEIKDIQSIYRPIGVGKKPALVPWLSFTFEPFSGLIEPFNVYPRRFTAMVRVHRQPSGLPELVVYICRALTKSSEPLRPALYLSFSQSTRVSTRIEKLSKEPLRLRFYHTGALMTVERHPLPLEACLEGFAEALPEGYPEDQIPGLVEREAATLLYLGDLELYNDGKTINRKLLRNLTLNCVAAAVVARYVREQIRKADEEA